MYRNEISGMVTGLSVQVGHITISSCPQITDDPKPLTRALNDVTVVFKSATGTGRGVRVGSNLVLTLSRFVPEHKLIPGHPELALVECAADDGTYACIGPDQPIDAFTTVLERVPGSPVLNQLTGEVCALVTGPGTTTPVPSLPLEPHERWLDLLSDAQLLESKRRHLKPVLRKYLTAVRSLGQQHEYERAESLAPDLQTIYLKRWAENDSDDEETALPPVIDADQLLTTYPNSQVVAEPGVGKSSLLRHFAAQTADAWLTRRGSTVVPVPITADALTRDNRLPEALADGVEADLNLTRPQLVELFAGAPLAGVRWLVLVDGLDEVIDPQARTRLLRRIGQLREDALYQVVVTSRYLSTKDITRFEKNGHPTYVLTPFNDADLDQFVTTWLADAGRPEAEASQLVARLRTSKLDTLIYVPLIATMVCALHCASPEDEPPRNQTELYRRYVDWQLSKVSQNDLGARLEAWQARSGRSAEKTAAKVRDELEPLLSEIAYGLLTVTPEPTVRDYAMSRIKNADREVVDEALPMSGLVVRRGQEMVFRHRTIMEYLAARHVFATRPKPRWLLEPSWGNRWEWPDLGMKVFLAALLTEDGADIRPQLRRLMWPTFRKQHIGFLAALVRHGVEVDEKVLARAVRLLTRTVRSAKTGKDWQQHVQWLHEIDTDATTAVLRAMVEQPGKITSNRLFEAIRYLIGMSTFDNMEFVVSYLKNPAVERIARNSVDLLLSAVDVKLSVQAFTELATDAPEPRLRFQGAEFVLRHDVDRGLQLLARLARHTSTSDDVRIRAIKLASEHDKALGFVLWGEFMTTARLEESRADAMELLYQHDPASTVAQLDRARKKLSLPVARRHEFSLFLVRRAGHDPQILLITAASHEVPQDQRVQAALLNATTNRERAVKILEDVVDRSSSDDRELLKNIRHLRSMDEAKGVQALVNLANDRHQKDERRMQAAEELPRIEAIEAYDQLADDPALEDDNKLVAARRLLKISHARGVEALVRIAQNHLVATPVRMKAAHDAKFERLEAGYRAYSSIAEDGTVMDTLRVKAALEAKRSNRSKGNKLLKSLVKVQLSGEAQLALAAALDRSDGVLLLQRMAGSTLPASHRLLAAERLITLGGAKVAADAYQKIADSTKGVSHLQRQEAQREATRLRKR
ncbi:hypothetical protein [Lentzea sp. NPDC051838]|uniref:NACHT domain-containing protein n=1 Tax=Lentzea sp. NPDC051838 TaxID=3154849 RepID=UPI003428216E